MAVPWLRRLVARLSPQSPGFVHVGFVVDKVALEQVFPRVFVFPLSISFHRCYIRRKKEKKLIIFIAGLHNKPQGLRCVRSIWCGALHHKNKNLWINSKELPDCTMSPPWEPQSSHCVRAAEIVVKWQTVFCSSDCTLSSLCPPLVVAGTLLCDINENLKFLTCGKKENVKEIITGSKYGNAAVGRSLTAAKCTKTS